MYFFSYKCDDYVSNEVDVQTIDKIRQSIMQIRDNENAEPNSNIEQIENVEKEEEASPITSELELSNKMELSPIMEESADTTPTSSCEAPNIEPGVSETAECKTSKLNKVCNIFYLYSIFVENKYLSVFLLIKFILQLAYFTV